MITDKPIDTKAVTRMMARHYTRKVEELAQKYADACVLMAQMAERQVRSTVDAVEMWEIVDRGHGLLDSRQCRALAEKYTSRMWIQRKALLRLADRAALALRELNAYSKNAQLEINDEMRKLPLELVREEPKPNPQA